MMIRCQTVLASGRLVFSVTVSYDSLTVRVKFELELKFELIIMSPSQAS
jgi:hypothetical protein